MKGPRFDPPSAVRWIVHTLEDAGHETWTVGGAVRDVLAGRAAGDWDLTTRARPADVRRLFRRTVPVGIDHGTVGILARDGAMYEITTFRKDVETDGRHAVVSFSDRLIDDLARRDFTINAIAWHPIRNEISDPYGGAEDLRAGVLRTVGTPSERFSEDYLRVLRALRFASRYGLRIDPPTWTAAVEAAPHLSTLSAERIREELLKILDADRRPSSALDLYAASGAMSVLYPELDRLRSTKHWPVTTASVDHLPPGRPLLRLAALLHDLSPHETAQVLVRLRLSNAQTDAVAHRAGAPPMPGPEASDADVRRWLATVGPDHLPGVARVALARARVGAGDPEVVVASWRRARAVRATRPPLVVGDLAIGGRDLIRLGLRPGPAFKEILQALLDRVLDDPRRNRPDELEDEVRRMVETGDFGG